MNIWIIILLVCVVALTVSNIIMYSMIKNLQKHDHTHFPTVDAASMYPFHNPLDIRVKHAERDIVTFGKTISYFAKLLKPMATDDLKETFRRKDKMFNQASLADIDTAIKEYTRVYGWDNDIMEHPMLNKHNMEVTDDGIKVRVNPFKNKEETNNGQSGTDESND